MSQYLQFRRWSRTSSRGEKALVGSALAVVVAMTSLALVPTGSDAGGETALAAGGVAAEDLAPGQDAPGAGGEVAAGDSAAVPADGAVPGAADGAAAGPAGSSGAQAVAAGGGAAGSSGGSGSSAGGSTAAGAAGSGTGAGPAAPGLAGRPQRAGAAASCARGVRGPGITDTTITVASVLLNLGGPIGNGAVGIASPEQQKEMSQAVVADLNAGGGAACRKIVVKYFEANPLDQSSARRACLDVVEARVYAVVDGSGFAYPQGAADCIAQNKIPIVAAPGPVPSQAKQLYPYYMSMSYDPTQSYRNAVFGMKRRGFFDPAKGFKKLGLYMDDCSPEVNELLLRDLARAGVPQKEISVYRFSCPPSGFASPSEASSAVVKHRQDGVTHVIPVTGGGSFKPYSTFAQQQGYKPTYTNGDYNGFPITTTGGTGPDRDNYDGTVAVTSLKIGMESSGFSDAPTEACKALYKRRGVNPAWVMNGYQGGSYCTMYAVFASAATKAPTLTRVDLHRGVAALGRFPMAYPNSDARFSLTDLVGGDEYWVVQYRKSCNCWKVVDRTRRPSER